MRREQWHHAVVNLAAHPVAWTFQNALRRLGPMRHVPGLGLVISGAECGREVLLRDKEFTKNGPGGFAAVITQVLGPHALTNMDGAAHRALRSKLSDVLSPANVDALIERACVPALARLRAELVAGGTVDLVSFMDTLSGGITCEMMGVAPAADDVEAVHREIARRGARISKAIGLRLLSPRRLATVLADCDWLWELARPNYERAAEATLIGRLRTAGLSFDEARGVLLMIFLGGTLTTAAALPRLMGLLVDSGQLAALRRDPSRASMTVDEGLRFLTPVPATTRITHGDTRVAGLPVRAGTRVIILTGNLARDASLFPDPDRFDITRTHDPRAKHLWYGSGPHFCFGFPLAQRELRLVIEMFAALPAPVRIVRRRPAWGAVVPAYASLRVRLDAAPAGLAAPTGPTP